MQNIHEKLVMKNCLSPNLGCIIDGIDVCSSYMNSHNVTPSLNSVYIFFLAFEAIIWHNWSSNMEIEPNISHAYKIDPIKF